MPRAGLTADRVIDAATAMSDEIGFSQLTLAGLAAKLGVRQPSLYKHITGLESLRKHVAMRAKADLADRLGRAAIGRARDDALIAMAYEYRLWAREHSGVYQAAQRSPEHGDTEDEAVTDRVLQVMAAVIEGYGLSGDDEIDAIRAFRATVHGFVSLELGGGLTFPRDLDHSYDRLVHALVTSLAKWNEPGVAPVAGRRKKQPRRS